MLRQLWSARERKAKPTCTPKPAPASSATDLYHCHEILAVHQLPIPQITEQTTPSDSLSPSRFFESLPGDDNDGTTAFPSIEGYLLGSFMPGVADFSTPGLGAGFAQHSFGEGFQDWGLYQGGVDSHGPV
jgi:hypothetical protein